MKLETATQPHFSMFSYASQPMRALSSIYSTVVENRGAAIAISVLSYATLASAKANDSKLDLKKWDFETLSQLIGEIELNTALKIGGCAIALLGAGIFLLRRGRSNETVEKKGDVAVQVEKPIDGKKEEGSFVSPQGPSVQVDLDATILPPTPGVVHQTPQNALRELKKTFRKELGEDPKIQAMLSLYTGLVIMAQGNIADARDQFKTGYNFVKKGEEIFDDLTCWVLKCDELIKAEAKQEQHQPLEGGKKNRNPAKAGPSQQQTQGERRKQAGQTRDAVATQLKFDAFSPIVPPQIAPEEQEKSNSNIPKSHAQEDQQQSPAQAKVAAAKKHKYNPDSPSFIPPKKAQGSSIEAASVPDKQPKAPTPPPVFKVPGASVKPSAVNPPASEQGPKAGNLPASEQEPKAGNLQDAISERKKNLRPLTTPVGGEKKEGELAKKIKSIRSNVADSPGTPWK